MGHSFDGSKVDNGKEIREPCDEQDSRKAANYANANFMLSYLLINKSSDFRFG